MPLAYANFLGWEYLSRHWVDSLDLWKINLSSLVSGAGDCLACHMCTHSIGIAKVVVQHLRNVKF